MSRPDHDPFSERTPPGKRQRLNILGGKFLVEAADTAVMKLAVDAFGDLPEHRLNGDCRCFKVQLVRSRQGQDWRRGNEPPPPTLSAGAGLLCSTLDAGNFAVIDVAMSRALISVSSGMLKLPYLARHELIELAFLTLASRAQGLVPLHAACIGAKGSGVVLMGAGGTGKSTLALHALAGGMVLLSEDSAFVVPESLLVTGVPNYLHLQSNALEFLPPGALRERLEGSPMIQRRNGARKLEVDLRRTPGKMARSPLRLAATVLLSRRSAGSRPTLHRLERDVFIRRLRREQAYAHGRDNWFEFERRVAAAPCYELRRTSHPETAIELLRELLASV